VFTFDKPVTGATATITEGAAGGRAEFNGNEVISFTGVERAVRHDQPQQCRVGRWRDWRQRQRALASWVT
jgi:hypothetical protein